VREPVRKPVRKTVRKTTFKYKLCPTPEQERAVGRILARCPDLSNAGLEERREAYRMGGVAVSRWQQEAQLKDIRAEVPEYAAILNTPPS
jgi:putative transposase